MQELRNSCTDLYFSCFKVSFPYENTAMVPGGYKTTDKEPEPGFGHRYSLVTGAREGAAATPHWGAAARAGRPREQIHYSFNLLGPPTAASMQLSLTGLLETMADWSDPDTALVDNVGVIIIS